MNPQTHIERFDVENADFKEVKKKVDEAFLPNIFLLFNALGAIDLKGENGLDKNATQEEKESKQHLTLDSMKQNLHKVFGVKNDFLAQMLFLFISEHAPLDHKINFHQFMSRLRMFWPKRENKTAHDDPERVWRERAERQARKSAMRLFMYEFMQVSGGQKPLITILDLVQLCCYFKAGSCTFGDECDVLMRKYKQLNIEPKYVHEMTEFGFQQYLKYVPYSVLIADLEYAFVGQI